MCRFEVVNHQGFLFFGFDTAQHDAKYEAQHAAQHAQAAQHVGQICAPQDPEIGIAKPGQEEQRQTHVSVKADDDHRGILLQRQGKEPVQQTCHQ